MTSIGEVTPPGATSPVPLFGQDGNVTDTYVTLGGFGLGIPTTGIPAYPGIQLATGLTQPITTASSSSPATSSTSSCSCPTARMTSTSSRSRPT